MVLQSEESGLGYCQLDLILHAGDQCEFVTDYCTGVEKQLNFFFHMYFCRYSGNNLAFITATVICIVTAFYLLASTAEKYLSPALSRISRKLGFSETLAGVTLLALANGAPDVVSSFTAGETLEGIPLILGSIFGAVLFVTLVVSGTVVWSAGEITANRISFMRDTVFLIGAGIYVLWLGLVQQEVSFLSGVGLFILYALYVFTVLALEQKAVDEAPNRKGLMNNSLAQLEMNPIAKAGIAVTIPRNEMKNLSPSKEQFSISTPYCSNRDVSQYFDINSTLDKDGFSNIEYVRNTGDSPTNSPTRSPTQSPTRIRSEKPAELRLTPDLMTTNYKPKDSFCRSLLTCSWLFEKNPIFRAYTKFWDFMRNITILPVDEKYWNKYYAMMHPFTCFWLILYITGNFWESLEGIWVGFWLFPLQLAIALIIWKFTDSDEMPPFENIYLLGAFLGSIAWIFIASGYVIHFLEFIGFMTNINTTFLGMSLLAWGNSVGDLFANRALAKMGYGVMALTGCFAGPLFNLLIGLGSLILRETLQNNFGRIPFELLNLEEGLIGNGSMLAFAVICGVIGSLIGSLVLGFVFK